MMQIDIPQIQIAQTRRHWTKPSFILLGSILILAIVMTVFGLLLPLRNTIIHGQRTYSLAKEVYQGLQNQDIVSAEERLKKTRQALEETKKSFSALSWTKFLPVVGDYAKDAEHFMSASSEGIEALELATKTVLPYADLLGLKGKGTFTGGTTEERIVKAVETLEKVIPELDRVGEKVILVKGELDFVNPSRYPVSISGRPLRQKIAEVKNLATAAEKLFTQASPLIKRLPTLMGSKGEKKYLVLFQNDGELRPTGGFITAYAIFKVDKGRLQLEVSDDMYRLDETIGKKVSPPQPIKDYLGEQVWYIRNSNFSPDFYVSMKTFQDIYNNSSEKRKIDGIIAVDTHVLLKMMEIIGPVTVYGVDFTTENVPACGCPQVIWELEKYADEPKSFARGGRKDLIGVLLSEMMKKTFSSPKQLLESLLPAMLAEIKQKHILFYFPDPDAQTGVEAIGGAGRIKVASSDSDYLHVSNANLGGAKSDLYIAEKVTLTVDVEKDKTTNNLVIEYHHTRRPDNCSLERKEGLCLSGIYRDYLRVYLPLGSKLIESRGFENKSKTFEDLGHTVIDGYFTVVPLGLARIQIKYTTPIKLTGTYKLMLQKQPGTRANHYKIIVNGKAQELSLLQDSELEFK